MIRIGMVLRIMLKRFLIALVQIYLNPKIKDGVLHGEKMENIQKVFLREYMILLHI